MPTQRLIDINTAAITYRTKCLMALDKKQYKNCIGAIISLNSLLPPSTEEKQYRIVFDSEEYYAKIKDSYILICKKCEKEIPKNTIKILNINLPEKEQIIFETKTKKIWICPKCSVENDLLKTKIIRDTLQKPYYHQVVPEHPTQGFGLISQTQYHEKMVDWVWVCLQSLEEAFTRFRDDNWNKKDDYDSLFEVDTTAEEE